MTEHAMPDARKLNEEHFEEQWATTPGLKQRFQFNLELTRKDFLFVMRSLNLERGNRAVLDVGFGNGMLLFTFDRSCRICGTELSKSAIAAANRRARREGYAEFSFQIPPDDNPIPFAPQSFDIVIASHVVEHVNDDIAFLRRLLRA